MTTPTRMILTAIELERLLQDRKWGPQNHRNIFEGAALAYFADKTRQAREAYQREEQDGRITWFTILQEEVAEAFEEAAAGDENKLREELLQVAAVAVAWIECLGRKQPQLELPF